jgi:predicted SprT family Zn-dependent metalloprotease
MSTEQREGLHLYLWENELKKDYDHINWAYSLKLYRPMIQIVEVDSFWGQWCPIDRKIKIAKRLIDNHTWDTVVNILKHEMAHQMDSDIFFGVGDHGEGFKRACKLLGLPPEYQCSSLDSGSKIFNWKEDLIQSDEQTENHTMIRRVEKLLSLAQSSNENEALAAMEKVMQIYQVYNIKRIESRTKSNYVYAVINLKKQRIESYQSTIGNILQEFYFTEVVYGGLYDAQSLKTYQVMELFGTKENVQMAEYVFYFLNSKVLDLWQDYSKKNMLPVKFKRSYMIGVLRGFSEKLREIKKSHLETIGTGSSLTIAENDEYLKRFVREKYPRLTNSSGSSSGIYSHAFESGKQDGKSIVINKGIETNASGRQSLYLS